MDKAITQQENRKRYQDFIRISESGAMQGMDAILNEFFFFCTFFKGLPSQDFIYRRLAGKPYNKHALWKAIQGGVKGFAKVILDSARNVTISDRQIISGEVAKTTDVLIATWLHDANILLENKIDEEDRYFGALGSIIRNQGYNVQYFLTPVTKNVAEDSLKLHNGLIINSWNLLPSLVDWASVFKNIIKALRLDIRIDEKISYIMGFFGLRYIKSQQLLRVFKNHFSKSNIRHIILPWEGQPEQKAICLAAHAAGIKVWGYFHAAFNGSYANLINNNWAWCPDVILINGFGYVPLLEDMGWKNKMQIIRSLRYQRPPEKASFEGKLFLPYDITESIITLKIIKTMVYDGKCRIKEIRCHPDNMKHPEIRTLISSIATNPHADEVYVGGFSSVLFEALQAGCTVYNIQSDTLNSEDAYGKFNKIKITRLNQSLVKFESIGDMKDYFFCFDDDKSFKLFS